MKIEDMFIKSILTIKNIKLQAKTVCGLMLLFALPMMGQDRAVVDTIRYVKTTDNGGAYTNNGRSWHRRRYA